ncbi:glyoxylase-like metal-dependent hydrolase (beta-lactamase superfamily II) [Alkalicoccobacillus murimartini]|uniref:Glyoxylase-like metal-dependent hydrolase (Beta-lactamase superfamily II) n=2 Tax=Alkalicoccobacillus murimartini TaxID=171685 RepID=A0ABT9YII4_9BACI|nr:MBL fold metallo-hydrolase [Alkalicoccobacillus murimartini]MDQ0207418.1 glyoxylase-like metal-dependent hydrolase (beta-lactamase superfamily II) [Alkalicoccobacillus murimartini]
MLKDPWFTVQQIDSTTYAISEYGHWEKVHSFLLIGESKAILIDTGLGIDDMSRVTSQLTELPIVVLTTHVHADHIGSHDKFDQIYVHEADKDWLVNGIQGLPIEQIRKDMGRDITIPTPESFDPQTYTPYQGEPAGLLHEGDVIELGNRSLKVLHTPGHSPGHLAFFDQERGYLFTGDLLYDETPVYAHYPSTNPVDLVNSLEKIASLNHVSMVYGAHNSVGLQPAILDEVKTAVAYLREHQLLTFGTGIHRFNGFSVQF